MLPMKRASWDVRTQRCCADIYRPVWHCSRALPASERLDGDKWEAIVADFMSQMCFESDIMPWVAIRHQDTDYDHVHLVASRIGLDGSVWLGQWEARTVIEATQILERNHGLTLTPGLGDARAERRALSGGRSTVRSARARSRRESRCRDC